MNTECYVCSDPSSGINYGSQSCRSCKDFFSRSNNKLKDKQQLKQLSQECLIKSCKINY